ncbi:MobA/MobL family protein [Macrococcoides caseolyticum]|uniref:MobA/MobL family protein n=1 Tax=Macrococcoides caseolyticum TaxID=69966 RepID=UPI0030EB9CF3
MPNDLERNVQRELVNNFVNDEFISRGMIADVSIHRDDINNRQKKKEEEKRKWSR